MRHSLDISIFFRWQLIVLIAILMAIGVHFLLRISSFEPIYHIPAQNIPLLFILVLCGIPLLFQIILKLLKRDLGADSLAGISILTGAYLGEYLAAAIVMLMLASGQLLESYALRKASSVLLALAQRMPSQAHRKEEECIEDIAIDKIQIGDFIVIYPHETCPVDGIVIEGRGFMDESYLTGEPYQISKAPGVEVISGSINGEALLTIRAEKQAQDSRYAKIIKVMEDSEQQRPKIRRLGDQLGAIFAPLTLIIAFFTWYFTGDPMRFLSVLVIATPCPLLIGIPITIISAISLAASKGIIIKDPIVLERLPTCKTAIFDKTGTLTYGQAKLIKIIPLSGFERDDVLQKVASLERFSKHPLASAILKAAEKSHIILSDVKEVHEKPGQGLIGTIQKTIIQVTSRKNLTLNDPDQAAFLPTTKTGMECIILIDDKVAAIFHFQDTLRAEGQVFIGHLAPIHHFKKIIIVSGDRKSEVKDIAKKLGIKEIYASQSPEQKVEIVRKETGKAPTLFMGDGINDAPALTAATVGLAFGQGNIITSEAAGAVILESSLSKVDELIHISGLIGKIIMISAGGGMLMSVIGMYFAAIGMIPPVMGAILQEGIDIIAILNALQLTWHRKISVDVR